MFAPEFYAFVLSPSVALSLYNDPLCFGSNFMSKGGPVIIDDTLQEPYFLSAEEILYLALHSKSVKFCHCHTSKTPSALLCVSSDPSIGFDMNVVELSQLITCMVSSLSQKALARICVYSHFKAEGWVIRSGLKYGSDFLLYSDKPGLVHSQYSIIISGSADGPPPLIGACRLTETVRKSLIICIIDSKINLNAISLWTNTDGQFAIPDIVSSLHLPTSWSP